MKLALQGKGKLVFVDGNCTKIKFRGKLEELGEKCNVIVLSWLIPNIVYALNAKKDLLSVDRNYSLRHGTDSVTSYYSRMKDLWNELDVMVPLPSCDCEESNAYIDHLKSQRLL
ncbi:hypothetical protein H5410_035010 [Solanum commersonii]|uniref:Uncharacterized protein n=1 Tax=Solanum commersonii TaxID=4109 RepID=A0A9J5Y1E3_SOLCO|nr:hypothetical protein H5410_035010 [Solanum commersonii]